MLLDVTPDVEGLAPRVIALQLPLIAPLCSSVQLRLQSQRVLFATYGLDGACCRRQRP